MSKFRISRILGEAKVIGALVNSCVGEREVAMDGIILVDLRTGAGSKKTIPDPVSFAARSEQDPSYRVHCVHCSTTQCS